MSGKIPADVLHRQCYNALLYSHKDTAAEGRTLWTRGGNNLRVTAFDDYFALTDTYAGLSHDQTAHGLMEIDLLKELEKSLRDESKPQEYSDLPLDPADSAFYPELYDADAICFPEGYLTLRPVDFVALSPDRLRKLSLIKPGGFPIDCAVYTDGTDDVIAFRCGPTVRGAMAPVDRTVLSELYLGEEVWR